MTASISARLEGHLLRPGVDELRAGRGFGKDAPHLGERLDGDHPRAGLEEPPGQLAGPRREVDDDGPGTDRERRDELGDRLVGISGPRPLVQPGDGAETQPRPGSAPARRL